MMWTVTGVGSRGGAGERRCRVVMTSSMKAEGGGLRAACLLLLAGITFAAFGDGASALDVFLRAPNYVFVGESALLKCEHGVSTTHLHKVEWLKDGEHKLFQFVRGRNPPFRNFTTPGATLDWSRSNDNEIRLTGLSLEASGIYSCEVSMETPIYTKPSNDERLVVIQRQSEDPVVYGVKASYFAGEKVAVNCTSSPSHPPVQIAWLVNGREVSDQLLTRFPEGPVRQYELTTHGAHHIRPFRTSSDDHFEDNYGSHESLPGDNIGNALGMNGGQSEKGGKKNDFLASAALGKLLYGSTTTPASPRGGRGGPAIATPTGAAPSSASRGRGSAVATTSGATVTSWTQQDDEDDSNPMDAFDPPEVVPVVTATASSTTVQLSFVLTDEVVRYLKKDSEDSGTLNMDPTVPKVRLILTCSAIIPETVDGKYADQRLTTVAADVILSEETTARFSSATHSSYATPQPCLLFLPLLASLLLLATISLPALLPPNQHKKMPTSLFLSKSHGATLPILSVLPRIDYSVNHVRPRR